MSDLVEIASTISKPDTNIGGVLKLEWDCDGELIIKKLSLIDNCFKTIFRLRVSKSEVVNVLSTIRELLREKCRSTSITTTRYDIDLDVSPNKRDTLLKISVMEISGQKSRPVGRGSFTKYMGGKTLLDGIRDFVTKEDLYNE